MKEFFINIPPIRGIFKYLVLYVLKEKPLHGYGVMQRINELIGWGYSPSPGIVYPTLQLLEDMEYVSSYKDGRKTVYKITDKGISILEEKKDVLSEFLSSIRHMETMFDEVGGLDIMKTIKKIIVNYHRLDEDDKRMIREASKEFRLKVEEILGGD